MRNRIYPAIITVLILALVLAMASCSNTDDKNSTAEKANTSHDFTQGSSTDSSSANAPEIKPGGNLEIPVSSLSEKPSYSTFRVDGVIMEVLAFKASDGTIRTAYNTCQVCNGSPKAYFEEVGDVLQCQNCGNEFPLDKVGLEKGGCNPAPITDEDRTVTDKNITISYEVLNAEKDNFTNWKGWNKGR